jgi:aryl-alcohol dehydrogenase-like predicted oxidoreductase
MKQRRLGRSGLVVSEICLGTMTFGSMADEATSFGIMDEAFEKGVDFLDAAETYPVPPSPKTAGRTEEIVGKWLARHRRDAVIVATKIAGPGGGWIPSVVRSGKTTLDRHAIAAAVDASLKRLGTDYIDLYQTHWPDPDLPIEETMEGLMRVVEAGKVRYVGCSNQTAYGLTKALWASDVRGLPRYETIQNNWSLLNRRFEDGLSEVCRRERVSLIPYSPIAGGVLSGKYQDGRWPDGARFTLYKDAHPRTATMTRRFVNEKTLASTARFIEIGKEAGMSSTTLAIAWTLTYDFVGSTIVGATRPTQLADLLRGAEVELGPDVRKACDQVTKEILYPMG